MKERRNPEYIKELIIMAVITLLMMLISIFVKLPVQIFILAEGIIFLIIHWVYARGRYKRTEELSGQIDRILHGAEKLPSGDKEAGDLAVLNSEIRKMASVLKEQQNTLAKEKIKLTDAISDISHQMRTPMTAMEITISMLAGEDIDTERRLHLTRELKKQMGRTGWLTETLLKISRIDAGTVEFEKEKIPIRDMVNDSAEPFLIQMELKSVEFIKDLDDACMEADPAWTREALGNLIKNALEHTPEGGSITIRNTDTPLFSEIVIEDTGEGFAKEDIPHLFERFYKGKNASSDSTGIGLALARMIITAQDGTIKAENREKGARFIIRFYKKII